jgi:hypothetical protein
VLDKSKIEVIEIVRVEERPVPRGEEVYAKGPFWKATIAFREPLGIILQSTWYLPVRDFPDSSVLPALRNYFHSLCADIADQTRDWRLDEAQHEALKRPPPKPPSSMTVSASKIPQ